MTLLLVDNLSPFTGDISTILKDLNLDFVTLRHNEIGFQSLSKWHGFVLSGRRHGSRETNSANARIVRHCVDEGKALLGICYGAEILALTLGGSIRRLPSKIFGQEIVQISRETDLTGGLDRSISVFEAHGLAIARIPPGFTTVASSSQCPHEIITSSDRKLWGTQFHPEKSGVIGSRILSNFASIAIR